MDILLRKLWVPGDPDACWLPSLDLVEGGNAVVRYRNLQDREFRKEVRRAIWRSEVGAAPSTVGPIAASQLVGRNLDGYFGAVSPTPVAVTPTGLGATTARIFPFLLDAGMYVGKIAIPGTANAVATSFQLGIFDQFGSQYYASGTQGTTANITVLTTNFFISAGMQRYQGFTNANLTSATTAYLFCPAFTAASLTYWGTVAATNGAMPGSITPGSITKTVGGWPIYTCLMQA